MIITATLDLTPTDITAYALYLGYTVDEGITEELYIKNHIENQVKKMVSDGFVNIARDSNTNSFIQSIPSIITTAESKITFQ